MRTVVYARYSTDRRRDALIDDQVRTCRQQIQREDSPGEVNGATARSDI